MKISTLKDRVNVGLPIYLGEIEVKVVEIFDMFNLIELDLKEGDKNVVVDVMALSEKPYIENAINVELFTARGGRPC